jgi:hypothetical protein
VPKKFNDSKDEGQAAVVGEEPAKPKTALERIKQDIKV